MLAQDRPPTACRRDGFRFSFTPLAGVLFAFPSRYWSTIGRQGIFSLGGWSPRLPTGLHVPRGTREHGSERSVRVRLPGSHRLWRPSPRPSTRARLGNSPGYTLSMSHNPARPKPNGLGSSPFARRYLGNHGCCLLLEVLRCFSSPGSPPDPMNSDRDTRALPRVGSPIRASAALGLLAAPRGFSQLATPFFASWRQGIHRPPFLS